MKRSQKELAKSAGIKHLPQLCKIEKGKNIPGDDVLRRIEDALGLNSFSLVELRNSLIESYKHPDDDGIDPEHPRLESVTPDVSVTSDEMDLLPAEILSTLDEYIELEDALGIPHFCRIHLGQFDATTEQDGIAIADSVRFRLDIGNAPIHTHIPILEQFNIRIIFLPDLPPIRLADGREKTRAALSLYDREAKNPVVCVNTSVSSESQLYHLAYELGCYFRAQHIKRTRRKPKQEEWVFARAFAATLLMPTTAILDLIDLLHIENDKWSPTLLYEVARRFGVSTQALIWRLDSLHRIDKVLFEHYRKNPPKGPYEPSAPLPHDVWLNTLRSRVGDTRNRTR